MKKIIIFFFIITILVLLGGNTHRILPTTMDDCQTDMTHLGYVEELPMYHCIGHTEFEVSPEKEGLLRIAKWDHLHSWMTLEWHLQKGFSKEQAIELISLSKK
jgi:hypothetical protein